MKKRIIEAEHSGNIHTVKAPEKDEHRTSNVQHRMLNETHASPTHASPTKGYAGQDKSDRVSVEEIRKFKEKLRGGKA